MDDNKKGLLKLGYVRNLKFTNGENCMTELSQITGREISQTELDNFIESEKFQKEYMDEYLNPCEEKSALLFRFETPFKDKNGKTLFGVFWRTTTSKRFMGVSWEIKYPLKRMGFISPQSLKQICESVKGNYDITIDNIDNFIDGDVEFYNGAGHKQYDDGTPVNRQTAKFIKFKTTLKTEEGEPLYGWFKKKKKKGTFEGINWGEEEKFKDTRELNEATFIGRIRFKHIDAANKFLEDLAQKAMDEPWNFKEQISRFKNPILKSYIEYELGRLFYEHEKLNRENKIVYNSDKSKIVFDTNLLDKFGNEIWIMGDIITIDDNEHIENPEISPNILNLTKCGFNKNTSLLPPEYFTNIDEIIFHCEWYIDYKDIEKNNHIIEERRSRFPQRFKSLHTTELGLKLQSAIEFAKKIAQRNYKFIVPMYYPTRKDIQFLMPIYLDKIYSNHPDFALVLTPHKEEKIYTLETILALNEVYQDARLIAKPEQSWLNSDIINNNDEESL